MKNDETIMFDRSLIQAKITKDTVREIYAILQEKGYNPMNQLVGYLMTGDLSYISNYQNARKRMSMIDRASLLEVMLKEYL